MSYLSHVLRSCMRQPRTFLQLYVCEGCFYVFQVSWCFFNNNPSLITYIRVRKLWMYLYCNLFYPATPNLCICSTIITCTVIYNVVICLRICDADKCALGTRITAVYINDEVIRAHPLFGCFPVLFDITRVIH